jgi:L-threonate 2-dehydrogenase
MKPVAFIGLGSMGLPMATNLVRRGFAVRGFDIAPAAMNALVKQGGSSASSAKEVASGAEFLVLMVVNAEQAENILFRDGALDALTPGGLVVLMATCPPAGVERIAERVLATGRRFLDAPVSGGVVGATGATGATLTIMAAGPEEVFNTAKPVLQALGDRIFYVGKKPGQGAMAKTVNQLLCGVHLAVAAEALSLASKAGVDLKAMLEIVTGSSAASWMLKDRGPRMLEKNPNITSAVDIFVKDLGIVLQAGDAIKAALPFAALARQLFLAVSGQGKGGVDDSQVILAYQALNGPQ